MGKLTISMAIFNSYVCHYQRVCHPVRTSGAIKSHYNPIIIPLNPIKPPFSYGFPMVYPHLFRWRAFGRSTDPQDISGMIPGWSPGWRWMTVIPTESLPWNPVSWGPKMAMAIRRWPGLVYITHITHEQLIYIYILYIYILKNMMHSQNVHHIHHHDSIYNTTYDIYIM